MKQLKEQLISVSFCQVKIHFLSHKHHFSEEHLKAKISCPNTPSPTLPTKEKMLVLFFLFKSIQLILPADGGGCSSLCC